VQSFRGASRGLRLPPAAAARWRQAARQGGGTLYTLLLAGFAGPVWASVLSTPTVL